jgi:hypothetical protein
VSAKAGSWRNEAHVARLKELHGEGHSASQIAKRLSAQFADADYSRNAVIGKLCRLGMGRSPGARHATNVFKNRQNMRGKQSASVSDLRTPTVKRDLHQNNGLNLGTKKFAKAPALAVAGNGAVFEKAPDATPDNVYLKASLSGIWQPLPGVDPVNILDLQHHHCRWPVDLAGAEFPHACGALAIGGRYCISHEQRSRRAVQPSGKGADKGLIRSLRRFAA